MSNVVASAIFCARNVDKAENQGKVGRWGVAAGQGKKVTDYVAGLDNKVGKTTKTAVESLKTFAQGSKTLEYAGKAVKFASNHVNPLICVSAGLDIAMADEKDKKAAIVTNVAGLSSMFAVENLMKKHMDEIPKLNCFKEISEKIMNFCSKTPARGKIPAIIHGVAFVVGSCAAYSVGEKFGNLLLGKKETKSGTEEELAA